MFHFSELRTVHSGFTGNVPTSSLQNTIKPKQIQLTRKNSIKFKRAPCRGQALLFSCMRAPPSGHGVHSHSCTRSQSLTRPPPIHNLGFFIQSRAMPCVERCQRGFSLVSLSRQLLPPLTVGHYCLTRPLIGSPSTWLKDNCLPLTTRAMPTGDALVAADGSMCRLGSCCCLG